MIEITTSSSISVKPLDLRSKSMIPHRMILDEGTPSPMRIDRRTGAMPGRDRWMKRA